MLVEIRLGRSGESKNMALRAKMSATIGQFYGHLWPRATARGSVLGSGEALAQLGLQHNMIRLTEAGTMKVLWLTTAYHARAKTARIFSASFIRGSMGAWAIDASVSPPLWLPNSPHNISQAAAVRSPQQGKLRLHKAATALRSLHASFAFVDQARSWGSANKHEGRSKLSSKLATHRARCARQAAHKEAH